MMSTKKDMVEITLHREQFLALQSMAHLASKDETTPILRAVCLTVDRHGWLAVATDRHVLGHLDGEIVTSDLSEGESVTATIPAQWLSRLKPWRNVPEVVLTLTPHSVSLTWDGAQHVIEAERRAAAVAVLMGEEVAR